MTIKNTFHGLQVTKCCPLGENLAGLSDTNFPQCVSDPAVDTVEWITGYDVNKDIDSRRVNISLIYDKLPRIPKCEGVPKFSVLEENSWLTTEGFLLDEAHGIQLHSEQFCVDFNSRGDLGAIFCPSCSEVSLKYLNSVPLLHSNLGSSMRKPLLSPWCHSYWRQRKLYNKNTQQDIFSRDLGRK